MWYSCSRGTRDRLHEPPCRLQRQRTHLHKASPISPPIGPFAGTLHLLCARIPSDSSELHIPAQLAIAKVPKLCHAVGLLTSVKFHASSTFHPSSDLWQRVDPWAGQNGTSPAPLAPIHTCHSSLLLLQYTSSRLNYLPLLRFGW
jgi:hypothetical protein